MKLTTIFIIFALTCASLFGQQAPKWPFTIGAGSNQLPIPSEFNTGKIYGISDGASANDCTVGSGVNFVVCISTGTLWLPITGNGGGGGGASLYTNGVLNSSQTVYNLQNSSSFNGLTVTATNISAGNVQLGLSGTLGNSGLTNSGISFTVPSWLTATSVSLGGTSTFASATGQTTHQVIGTCGSATTFTPCSLVVGDLPSGYAYSNLSGTPTIEYQLIGNGGTSQTARNRLNLIAGSQISLMFADNSGSNSTDVTIAASLAQLQTNSVNNSSQTLLNFVNGSPYQGLSINFSNPSGGVVQAILSGTFTGAVTTFMLSNAGSTGTTLNTLTKAPAGLALIAATTDTNGIIGITTSGAGTSGQATISYNGAVLCVFDGGTSIGDYVTISTTTPGNCHDTGSSTVPPSGQVIGRVWSTNGSGPGPYTIDLFPANNPPIIAGTGLQSAFSATGQTLNVITTAIASITSLINGDITTSFSATGTSAYSATPVSGCSTVAALKNGMTTYLSVDVTNATGAATLVYCGVGGTKSIKNPDGVTDPSVNIIPTATPFPIAYNGSVWLLPSWLAFNYPPEAWIAGTGGTTQYTLVTGDASNPQKIVGGGGYGIALATITATNLVNVGRYGTYPCIADTGGITASHLVLEGVATPIDCSDSQQTSSAAVPIGTRIIGKARTTATAGNTALIDLTPDHFGTLLTTNNAWSLGTITAKHLACFTANNTVGNCTGIPSNNILGVFNDTAGNIAYTGAIVTGLVLDTTQSVTFGDILCVSATVAGVVHDNGSTSCSVGDLIGVVQTTASSVSSVTAMLILANASTTGAGITSIVAGFCLTGGTITTTGSIAVDTTECPSNTIIQNNSLLYLNSATGNASYAAQPSQALAAYQTGQMFLLTTDTTCSTAATLNINTGTPLGAVTIDQLGGLNACNGAIVANSPYLLYYDGTNSIFRLMTGIGSLAPYVTLTNAGNLNFAAHGTFAAAGAASTPGLQVTGAPFTAGSPAGTQNFPQFYINDGTGPTTLSANGTEFGINTPSGFSGNFMDFRVNGGASLFSVASSGAITSNSLITAGTNYQNAVGGAFRWGPATTGRDIINSPADQQFQITGTAGSNIGFPSATGPEAGSVCVDSSGNFSYDPSMTCLMSSRTFKHAIQPVIDAEFLYALKPVSFIYNETPDHRDDPDRRYGLIAEEVEKVAPQLVVEGPDGSPIQVKYLELIPLLIQTAKDQHAEIESLKVQIRILEAR